MEWWKLFSGTFVLIFLAELGDKTQLAAMAKTADSPDSSSAKWIVFLAASLALAFSTFIAVFLGHVLKSIVPDERYIKIAAAVLFLVFGFMILHETYTSFAAERAATRRIPAATEEEEVEAESSLAGTLALRAAIDFEALAVSRYRQFAKKAKPQLASLLEELAKEEEGHLHRLEELPADELPCAVRSGIHGTGVSGRSIVVEGDDARIVTDLIAHEDATAAFYRDLADRTLIGSVKTVLSKLAAEESEHAKRLRDTLKA